MIIEHVTSYPPDKQTHKFKLANVVVAVSYDAREIDFFLGPNPFYTPFRTQLPEDISIKIVRAKTLPRIPKQANLVFDGDHWKLYREGKNFRMELHHTKTGERDRSATISADFTKVTVAVKKARWQMNHFMRPLGETLLIQYLSKRQGILVHGCSVRDHNKGYLFSGYSGSGKTTLSYFWRDQIGDFGLLNDEKSILQKVNGQWMISGTPWPGDGMMVESAFVPLSHIFLIRHGKSNQIREALKSILFQELFTQTFSTFWNKDDLTRVADICEQVISEVPCYQYEFIKKKSACTFISDFTQNNKPTPLKSSWKASPSTATLTV